MEKDPKIISGKAIAKEIRADIKNRTEDFEKKHGRRPGLSVVLIGQDEDGIYIAKVPDIPGCYTQGKNVEQAMERVKEAIQVCLEADELKIFCR